MKLYTLVALAISLMASPTFAQVRAAAPAAQASTGIDAIVALVNAGIAEAFILKSIQNGGTAYNLTPTDLVRLKTAGASDRVIEAMLNPASVTSTAATPAVAAPVPPPTAAAPPQTSSGKPSFMQRLGNRLAATAEQTVDNMANSAATAADNASAKATKSVDKKLGVEGNAAPAKP